jgi:serine/threonine-protein kinase RsbW
MPVEECSISLAGGLEEIARLGEWVTAFCERSGLGEKAAFGLNLALEELVSNSIGHGGASGARVKLRLAGSAIEAEIADNGDAFDPTAVAPPDLSGSIGERQIGGLGIHLVRRLVQDLAFERRGNENRLSFRMTVE